MLQRMGTLNDSLLLPILKTKMGISDIIMCLACLNIQPPSKSGMHTTLNKLMDTVE